MMRITNVQGIKKEYYGNFEVLYFLFMNWYMLSVRTSRTEGKFRELGSTHARVYNV